MLIKTYLTLCLCLCLVTSALAGLLEQGFSAQYDVQRNGTYLGVSDNTLTKLPDGRMQYRTDIEPRGFVGLFLSDRITEISTFVIRDESLQVLQYLYHHTKGKHDKKKYELRFDWPQQHLYSSDFQQPFALAPHTQDGLSFQLYLMHQAQRHVATLAIPIATRRETTLYNLIYKGETTLPTPLGKFVTFLFESEKNGKERYRLWLAKELDCLPVKIQNVDADGAIIELELRTLTKTAPAIPAAR
jgi:Protein of unknown function (DUF3108)